MSIDRPTLLFFDASCLIAAAGSPTGGSAFLLSLCTRGLLQGAVSQFVLLEAERNINAKLGQTAATAFHHLLTLTPLTLASVPPQPLQHAVHHGINQKDAHVVAATLAVAAPYLLTLDKRLAVQINHARLSVAALSPGDFIKSILPHHIDFSAIRP
jgi:predicted nucleic acid-binding protein